MRAQILAILVALLPISRIAADASADPGVREWKFTVRLDDRPVGTHTFRVSTNAEEIVVESRARFDVRLLGLTLYSYEHRADEVWHHDCLARLDSRTDDNGDVQSVHGEQQADGFLVREGDANRLLPPCTLSFAYWNPKFREHRQLLNPQDGKELDTGIRFEGRDVATVAGKSVDANRYQLTATDLQITLWYSADTDRWLALDSLTSSGRRISYRLE